MRRRIRATVFVLHGVVTIAAAVVLAVAPAAIPATVGIALDREAHLLAYLLAGAELGIGVLSLGAARLRDPRAIRLIAGSFAVFHGATAVLEAVQLATTGLDGVLLANLAVRAVAAIVFVAIAWRP